MSVVGINLCQILKTVLLVVALMFARGNSYAACIGVVTAGGGVDFWTEIGKGALQAGKDNNYEVVVRGPRNESDAKSQQAIIEKMVNIGCTGLVVAPNSADRVAQLQKIVASGVKSVFIDRSFGHTTINTIKTDNLKAGALAGKTMARLLPTGANIAIFRLDPNVTSTSDRETGFIEQALTAGLNIIADPYIGSSSDDANLNAYNFLLKTPKIDGIFTPNESTSLAVLNMRKRLPSQRPVTHIGFDSHPALLRGIETGELAAIVIQNPFQMGYQGVEAVIQLLEGRDIPQNIETPTRLISNSTSR